MPLNFEIVYLYNKNLKKQVENEIITKIENNSKYLGEIVPIIVLKEGDNYYYLNEINIKMRNDYDILRNL